jgi:hypothetical protein
MSTALWIIQALLALAFVGAGATKLLVPKEKLAPKMGYVNDFSATSVKLIGAAEVAGGLGILLPNLTGIAPLLTPIAGGALAVLMLGGAYTHVRRKEMPMVVPPLVLGALAAFVAYARFAIVAR